MAGNDETVGANLAALEQAAAIFAGVASAAPGMPAAIPSIGEPGADEALATFTHTAASHVAALGESARHASSNLRKVKDNFVEAGE